nr:hypothetical protein GCM10010200_035080 [Actinomadura rugatobispora]
MDVRDKARTAAAELTRRRGGPKGLPVREALQAELDVFARHWDDSSVAENVERFFTGRRGCHAQVR